MLSASPLLCNIFWCFLIYSRAIDDVLSVFRLYSDVVADIQHDFIMPVLIFLSLTFLSVLLYVILPTGVLNCS